MADDHMEVSLVANFNGNPRVQWTPLLHERFILAVTELGGPYEAKPKAIKECMGAHGLTLRHIKSHLQKYRASFGGARSKNDMKSDEQLDSGNNVPSPNMSTTGDDDIGGQKVYDVSEVQIGTKEIPSTTFAPCNIGGDEFRDVSKIQTGTEGIPSMMHVHDTARYGFHDVSKVQTGTGGIPSMKHVHDIGRHGFHDVSKVQTGIGGIPSLMHVPDTGRLGFHDVSKVQTGTEGTPSIMSASYDIGGLALYGLSEIPIGTERIPYMFTDPNDIRSEDVFALPTMPNIGTEEIPYQVPPPRTTGNHEVYGIYEHQIGTKEIAKSEERYTHSFTNGRCQNDAGKQPEAYATAMDYPSNNILSLPNWEPSPYTMGNHEVYNEPTILLGAEGGITTQMEEHQSYKCSLDSVFNEKYNETMGLHPQDATVVTHNMPMFNMLPTPNGMGCHGLYDGSSVQRELERSVQQTNEADMHVMLHEDAHKKYMKSLMEMASKLLSSD